MAKARPFDDADLDAMTRTTWETAEELMVEYHEILVEVRETQPTLREDVIGVLETHLHACERAIESRDLATYLPASRALRQALATLHQHLHRVH
jgi:hypothetical protein